MTYEIYAEEAQLYMNRDAWFTMTHGTCRIDLGINGGNLDIYGQGILVSFANPVEDMVLINRECRDVVDAADEGDEDYDFTVMTAGDDLIEFINELDEDTAKVLWDAAIAAGAKTY